MPGKRKKFIIAPLLLNEIDAAVNIALSGELMLARKMAVYVYLCHQFSGEKLKVIGEHFNLGES